MPAALRTWLNMPFVVKQGYPGGFSNFAGRFTAWRNDATGSTKVATLIAAVKISSFVLP